MCMGHFLYYATKHISYYNHTFMWRTKIVLLIGLCLIFVVTNFSIWHLSERKNFRFSPRSQGAHRGANSRYGAAAGQRSIMDIYNRAEQPIRLGHEMEENAHKGGNEDDDVLPDLPCPDFRCRFIGAFADDVPGLGSIGSFDVSRVEECAALCERYKNCASFEFAIKTPGQDSCHLDTKSPRSGLKYGLYGLYLKRKAFKRSEVFPPNQPPWKPVLGGSNARELDVWINQELPKIPTVPMDPLGFVLGTSLVDQRGNWLEFGVFQGDTANQIAAHRLVTDEGGEGFGVVYGFDSFVGLPEDWKIGAQGSEDAGARVIFRDTFNLRGTLPDVKDNVRLVKGWFNETLPLFLEQHPEQVTLLHIDSDLYSSAFYVLQTIAPFLQPGSIIVFDELINFPQFRNHEMRALYEFISSTGFSFEWISCACGVDSVKNLPVGALEGDGFCLSVALRLLEKD